MQFIIVLRSRLVGLHIFLSRLVVELIVRQETDRHVCQGLGDHQHADHGGLLNEEDNRDVAGVRYQYADPDPLEGRIPGRACVSKDQVSEPQAHDGQREVADRRPGLHRDDTIPLICRQGDQYKAQDGACQQQVFKPSILGGRTAAARPPTSGYRTPSPL